jgi:lipopolysaccharide/colanic/teichoic acid biosynthesis glycosyltransferase
MFSEQVRTADVDMEREMLRPGQVASAGTGITDIPGRDIVDSGPERPLATLQAVGGEDTVGWGVQRPVDSSLFETVSSRPLTDLLLRAVNVAVAGVSLLVLSPLILLIAIAIKLDSPGPILFRQLRVGLDRREFERGVTGDAPYSGRRGVDIGGRPFTIYKFRTMHVDAEKETGPVWAARDDDRITRAGRMLRRYRLDEIPQFLNVVRGEMAVVGPRPERPVFVTHLREHLEHYRLRHRVPPGITGWAQVNQQPDQTIDDVRSKLDYDLEYLRRRSLAFDLRIMLRTLPVMLGEGSGSERRET